jgi:hypothetical protein
MIQPTEPTPSTPTLIQPAEPTPSTPTLIQPAEPTHVLGVGSVG